MRILLVDDSQTIIHVMTKNLNELGYTDIVKAHTCAEAKTKIRTSDQIPALIISDWNMPGETGLDLLKYVRSNQSIANTPFIILTSDHDKSKIFQAMQYKPQFYLLKPCNKQILAEKLQSLAGTHGIQPPKGSAVECFGGSGDNVSTESNRERISENELSNSEVMAKILKQCVFVLNGRKSPSEFHSFLGKEIFKIPHQKISQQHVQQLFETLCSIMQQMLKSAVNE